MGKTDGGGGIIDLEAHLVGVVGVNYDQLQNMTPALVFKIIDKYTEHNRQQFKQDYELTRLMVNAWGGKLKSYDELTGNIQKAKVKIERGSGTDPI